jgi:alkylhydroperoxidase family enzyme
MAFIGIIEPSVAEGGLKLVYNQAERRAGKVFNILKIMSRSPASLKASMDLYKATMFGLSELSRTQREMLALVVSAANHCHY